MSNALHDYAKLFEKYAANNGGTGVILPGEDCLSLANEMRMDADDIDAENAKLREEIEAAKHDLSLFSGELVTSKLQNAKLRELVRDVYKAAHMLCEAWDGSCSKEADGMSLHSVCPIGDTSELCVFGKLDDRMRELRVEVDG